MGTAGAGGRRWWAHLTFTRMNIGPIMLGNQIEDRMEILELVRSSGAFRTNHLSGSARVSPPEVAETLSKSHGWMPSCANISARL